VTEVGKFAGGGKLSMFKWVMGGGKLSTLTWGIFVTVALTEGVPMDTGRGLGPFTYTDGTFEIVVEIGVAFVTLVDIDALVTLTGMVPERVTGREEGAEIEVGISVHRSMPQVAATPK